MYETQLSFEAHTETRNCGHPTCPSYISLTFSSSNALSERAVKSIYSAEHAAYFSTYRGIMN